MQKSLKLFMDGLIDYAGLFPPSALEMEPAIRNFAKYRLDGDKSMLSHFICPAARLPELNAYSDELFSVEPPFLFSVLCGGGNDQDAFIEKLETDFEYIAQFCKKHENRVKVGVLEIKLPGLPETDDELILMLNISARLTNARLRDEVTAFYEITRDDNWSRNVERTVRSLSAHNREMRGGVRYIQGGFKLRCGGVKAEMFPTVDQVTAAIYQCAANNTALKATAGLHHPVRHFNESVNTKMHGFFNVFGAAIIAATHGVDENIIRQIISEEDPAAFEFDEQYFSWKNYKVPTDSVGQYRRSLAISYGSCSFEEPREDLRNLGLM